MNINNAKLVELIKDWYLKHKNTEKLWTRNIVGKTIKDIVDKENHWKALSRGDARKGYKEMMRKEREG